MPIIMPNGQPNNQGLPIQQIFIGTFTNVLASVATDHMLSPQEVAQRAMEVTCVGLSMIGINIEMKRVPEE